jgi:predicted NUDIX family NTP pyrophosphohydrolase
MTHKKSAGLLVYRLREGRIEVFLVHMGGPYWKDKDTGAWTIPKGEFGPEEEPLDAAMREFSEETGLSVGGDFEPLSPVTQKGGKEVIAFAVEADPDPSKVRSNTFTTEWPPNSGKMQEFPEVDRAAWFSIAEARRKVISGQAGLLDELEAKLGKRKSG